MFMTLEMSDGATAIINPAHITHVTPSDPAYAEDGSVVHFVSDRAIQLRMDVASLERLLEESGAKRVGPKGEAPFLISG